MSGNDDLEDALWSNSFYLSPLVILLLLLSNHIFNLRKTVNIPNSALTRLIAAGLEPAGTQKTSSMKVSPSMKALESILNGDESTPSSLDKYDIIPEEDEAVHYTHMEATGSVSTFHTAKSSEAVDAMSNPGSHQHSSSISTIGEGYSLNDDTPKLDQPAAFYTVKRTNKDYSPQLRAVNSSFPEKDAASGESKISHESADSEQETTLLGDEGYKKERRELSKEEELVNDDDVRTVNEPSKDNEATPLAKATQPVRSLVQGVEAEKAVTPADTPNTGTLEPQSVFLPNATLEEPYEIKKTQKTIIGSPKITSMLDLPGILSEPFRPRESPRSTSSAFATPRTMVTASSIAEDSPKIYKRSNTVGDLSAMGKRDFKSEIDDLKKDFKKPSGSTSAASNTNPVPAEKVTSKAGKRFSFRGMFKIKSKSHALDKLREVPEEPSKPTKIHSKSFSTPNFSQFRDKPVTESKQPKQPKQPKEPKKAKELKEPSEPKESKNFFRMRRKSDASILTPLDAVKVQSSPQTTPKVSAKPFPQQPVKALPKSPAQPSTTPEAAPPQELPVIIVPPQAPDSPGRNDSRTIREVDDSDYLPKFDYPEPEEFNDRDEYDSQNLLSDPPKRFANDQYGEEISLDLSPDLLRMPLDPNASRGMFGSPFAVNYSSAENTPRLPQPILPKVNDSLLGDTLFPKSLNPHEVESIVSLERSRSMRLIKSNGKRSLFINYDGSDDNIVIGELATPATTGIRRSGSILKNSLSAQSLGDIVNLIDAAMVVEASESPETTLEMADAVEEDTPAVYGDEEFHAFIEFTDFIDVDDLDFSTLPSTSVSPTLLPEVVLEREPEPQSPALDFKPEIIEPPVQISVEAEPEVEVAEEVPETIKSNVIYVTSDTLEEALPRTPTMDLPHEDIVSPESISKSPILDTAYKMAMNESASRPISMSFKGFRGPGLHQLTLSNTSESSAVGQGFGSDSEDDYSFDDSDPMPQARHPLDKTALQPPGPFYHDRIPSLSDHSAASSPKLLTSFISRFRKSPLPQLQMALKSGGVRFSSRIILYDTYNGDEYDRHPDVATCNQLTPMLAQQIKEELNELKSVMVVHHESRCYTHFL